MYDYITRNPDTKEYTWSDGETSFSFRLIGKPDYLEDHGEYEECLRFVAEGDDGNRFDVFIMRLTPDTWDWQDPQW